METIFLTISFQSGKWKPHFCQEKSILQLNNFILAWNYYYSFMILASANNCLLVETIPSIVKSFFVFKKFLILATN